MTQRELACKNVAQALVREATPIRYELQEQAMECLRQATQGQPTFERTTGALRHSGSEVERSEDEVADGLGGDMADETDDYTAELLPASAVSVAQIQLG